MIGYLIFYVYISSEQYSEQIAVSVGLQPLLSPTAKVYSPVLTERKIYMGSSDEVMFDFVEGNEPHWMNLKSSHCESIEIH